MDVARTAKRQGNNVTIAYRRKLEEAPATKLEINESKKMIQMNLFTKQKQTHRLQKQTYGQQRGKVGGRDKLGVWE